VTLPLPRLIPLVLLGVAAAGMGLIVTGHPPGQSSGDPAARRAIEEELGHNANLRGGKFDVTVEVKAEGAAAARLSDPISMRMNGAFSKGRQRRQDKLFLDAFVQAAGQSVRFGAISTGNQAFVRFGGNYYTVSRSELERLYGQQLSAPRNQPAIAALGFDPNDWIEDARDEGTESVGGVQTKHLSAKIDSDAMFTDLFDAAARVQPAGTAKVSQDQFNEVKDAIKDPKVDVYVGEADGILRRVRLGASIEAKDGSGTLTADVVFSDINRPQAISAPPTAKPFSQLEGDLSSGGVGALAAGGAASQSIGASPAGVAPRTSAAAGESPYLSCIRKARGASALERCVALLP
jgi:hypothetical protein